MPRENANNLLNALYGEHLTYEQRKVIDDMLNISDPYGARYSDQFPGDGTDADRADFLLLENIRRMISNEVYTYLKRKKMVAAEIAADQEVTQEMVNALPGYNVPGAFVPPDWDAAYDYAPGDLVTHNGKEWMALDDVAVGHAPDDVYEPDLSSGGWAPYDGA